MIHIQERRAHEEKRRQDEIGQHEGNRLRLASLRVQEDEEERAAHAVHEPERCDPADGVHEVDPSERAPAPKGGADAEALPYRRRRYKKGT